MKRASPTVHYLARSWLLTGLMLGGPIWTVNAIAGVPAAAPGRIDEITSHLSTINMFKQEAGKIRSATLKDFVDSRVVLLNKELDMVGQLRLPAVRNEAMGKTIDLIQNAPFDERPTGTGTSSTLPAAGSVPASPTNTVPAAPGNALSDL